MTRDREWLRKIFYARTVEFETPELDEPGMNRLIEGLQMYLEEHVTEGAPILWMLDEMEKRVTWGPDVEMLEVGASPYFVTSALLVLFESRLTSIGGERAVLGHRPGDSVVSGAYRLKVGDRSWRIPSHNLNVELTRWPFRDRQFDVVVCNEILEHLHYLPTYMLTEIHRVLRPGGLLFLTTPNGACIRKAIEILSGSSFFLPFNELGPYGRHSREYTFDELADMLLGVGFRIEVIESINVVPRFEDDWRRFLYRFLNRMPSRWTRKLREHLVAVASRGEQEGREYYPKYLINGDPDLIKQRYFRNRATNSRLSHHKPGEGVEPDIAR